MINTQKINEIQNFVFYSHGKQFRDDGELYYNHLDRVAANAAYFVANFNDYYSYQEYLYIQAIALLHDFYEDCEHHRLQSIELDETILKNMRILTNDKHNSLEDRTLQFDHLAVIVKVYDRIDNLQSCIKVWDSGRIQRYLDKSYSFLDALKRRNKNTRTENALITLLGWAIQDAELALKRNLLKV
jgi:(p)ppGpp synthase/HD superfamily hydrolase